MVKIYWTDAAMLQPDSLPALSSYRLERLGDLKVESARRASLAAELLLIHALGREAPETVLPLRIETDENGKPYLADGSFFFNLSHSERFSACALADHEIGLDIQITVPCRENLVRRFFATEEQQAVFSSKDRDAAFSRIWCRKESFLKAVGLGLRMDLNSFSLAGDRPELSYAGRSYAIREKQIGNLFLCLCAESAFLPDQLTVERIEFS